MEIDEDAFKQFITVLDAAAMYNIKPQAVRNAIYRGSLRQYEIYGSKVLKRDEFIAWRETSGGRGAPKKTLQVQQDKEDKTGNGEQ